MCLSDSFIAAILRPGEKMASTARRGPGTWPTKRPPNANWEWVGACRPRVAQTRLACEEGVSQIIRTFLEFSLIVFPLFLEGY